MEWFSLLLSTFGLLFALIDPPGYIPLFLTLTAGDSEDGRRRILKRACIAAFVFLATFTFVGNLLLKFFAISIPALQISGGLILLVIGFEMLNMLPRGEKTTKTEQNEASTKEDVSIIPLAIPMLAGPASIVAVIVLASREASLSNYAAILVSIAITLGITYAMLQFAQRILHRIGVTGLRVLTRVMGLLLCAMAVQFVIDGYLAVK
ncbi:MarC family protein [bacterium]|nr:MarC family protein [bacterium]